MFVVFSDLVTDGIILIISLSVPDGKIKERFFVLPAEKGLPPLEKFGKIKVDTLVTHSIETT